MQFLCALFYRFPDLLGQLLVFVDVFLEAFKVQAHEGEHFIPSWVLPVVYHLNTREGGGGHSLHCNSHVLLFSSFGEITRRGTGLVILGQRLGVKLEYLCKVIPRTIIGRGSLQ